MAADDRAIVVGIRLYPGFSRLDGPSNDAEAFRDWLVDASGGAVDPANVALLLTSSFHPPDPAGVTDAHPVEDEINALFRPLLPEAALQRRIGRRLYIFLAGHGFGDPTDMQTAALYAANADQFSFPHVAGTAYAEWFRRSGAFDEVVLIMDCCRIAAPLFSVRPPPVPRITASSRASSVRRFYAFAAGWNGVARERDIGGKVRGIFTVALIDALRLAPSNRLGRVTGSLVKDYLHNHIGTVAGGVAINPPEIVVDSSREIVFAERAAPPGATVHVHLTPFAGGETVVILAGSRAEVARVTASSADLELSLEPGIYKACVEGTGRETLFEVVGREISIAL